MDVELDDVARQVEGHGFWVGYLEAVASPSSLVGIHLAVFAEPFLTLTLSGRKTVDSCFSRVRCAPYGGIDDGDVVLIKEVAGPVRGITLVRRAWHYDLGVEPISTIRNRFGASICADDEFWSSRTDALYATLIELDVTTPIKALRCDKRDRRGWVTLRSRQMSFDFG